MPDKDQLKKQAQDGLEQYLSLKGINTKKPFRCLSPSHEDKNPSMTFDPRRNRVHCFACGVDWDIFDLIGAEYGLSTFPEKLTKALEVTGGSPTFLLEKRKVAKENPSVSFENPTPKAKQGVKRDLIPLAGSGAEPQRSPVPLRTYLSQRGLSPAIAQRFGLRFDPDFGPGHWQALIIPTGQDSFTARNMDAGADKKNRIRKQGASPVFNRDVLFTDGPPVFVVEGEIDALSIYEGGGEAVALGSTANVQRLLSLLRERRPKRTLLICLDRDESGKRASKDLCEGLQALDIKHYAVTLGDEKALDPNDALVADPEGFAAQVAGLSQMEEDAEAAARAEYEQTSLASVYDGFLAGLSKAVDTPCVPTGFGRLDLHLDGGLYEGLYIVGAISSLGKTSLVLQIADQIAASCQDVLLFSLEMAREELLAKSLSRMTLMEAMRQKIDTGFAKTTRGITVASRWTAYSQIDHNLFYDAAQRYRPATKHLYVHEGVGDIGAAEIAERVRRHVHFTGRTPVVIIDYLQILAPHSDRATDKQNMDKSVLELKRLSRDLRLPLIAISSFNRASYKEAVTMEAFKESGAIEYSSDVLIGLQLKGAGQQGFDPTVEKEKEPREVELVILKNRHGPAGRRVVYDYYPRYHYFKER